MPKRKATSALVTREPSPHIESHQLRLDLDCQRLHADEMVGELEDGSVMMSSSEYNENVGHAHPVKDETCMLCTTPGEIEETGTLQCSVCYENLIEDDDVGCGVCSQGETPVRMHARCRTRWTQYQMCHGISPTCPACRSLVEIIVVCVRTLTGRSIQVGVLGKEGYATVRHLMDATEAQEAIPWQAMRFVFKDRELLPEDKLVDAGIVHGTSVDMVLRVARLEYELLATEFEAVPHPDSPASLRCSLCKAVVTDPVRSASGKLFQRAALMAWMAIRGDLCPVTHSKVLPTVDDPTTRSAAADWLQGTTILTSNFYRYRCVCVCVYVCVCGCARSRARAFEFRVMSGISLPEI
jgi:hypothetical protein